MTALYFTVDLYFYTWLFSLDNRIYSGIVTRLYNHAAFLVHTFGSRPVHQTLSFLLLASQISSIWWNFIQLTQPMNSFDEIKMKQHKKNCIFFDFN